VGETRRLVGLHKRAERPVWAVRWSALTGLFLVLLGLALLFERLAGLFGGGLAGRLIGHVNPLSLREAYSRRQYRTCPETIMMFLSPVRRGGSHGPVQDVLAAAIETKHFINAPEAIDEGRLPTAWVGGYLKPFAFDLLAN